ncbi:glycosyltransferase [Mycolicibacterium elephantis]
MKIVIAAQTFAPQDEGGAEISTRLAAMELQGRHDVVVLSLGHSRDAVANAGTSVQDGIRVIRIPFHAPYLPGPQPSQSSLLEKAAWHTKVMRGAVDPSDVAQVLEVEAPDIIYSQCTARMQPALWRCAQSMGIPVVQHLRDYSFLCPKSSMFKGNANCEQRCRACKFLTSRLEPASEGVQTVIAVSDFVRRRYLAHGMFKQARWHVMHNTNTPLAAFNDDAMERRIKGEQQPFTFGYLGSLSSEKGVEDLLNAFVRLETDIKARLILGGRGNEAYVAELKEKMRGKPVEFLGYVPAHDVYGAADVMVSCSRWHEPQSRILVESAVYGVPIIATNRGGSPEVITSSKIGWVYDPDKPNDLYDALTRALQLKRSGWEKAREASFPGLSRFNGTAEASKYYQRLEQILEGALKPSGSG